MRNILVWALVALFVAGAWAEEGLSTSQQVDNMLMQAPHVNGQIIVKYKEGRVAAMDGSMDNLGNNTYCVSLRSDMKETLMSLLSNEDVEYAEPNYIYRTMATPNDPKFGQLWGMNKINAPAAWNAKSKADRVIVAVIDTGINYKHEDLKDNVWVNKNEVAGNGIDDDGNGYIDDIHGINGINDSGDPMDDHSHGSHCMGTIAGTGNNNVGVTGVCWQAQVMGCKFLSASGGGSSADAVKCINYAVANGAKVLSNSWGGGGFSLALYNAIKDAGDKGVLFVAAAGNSYKSSLSLPAGYCQDQDFQGKTYPGLSNVLAVSASDESDNKASFSQYSAAAAKSRDLIAAPGTNILSTTLGNNYASYNGTSMATPHVAGAATLIWANNMNLTALEIKKVLTDSGDTLQWGDWFSKYDIQRLNLEQALKQSK